MNILKRLQELEKRQPRHMTVRAKDPGGNVREMTVGEMIDTKSDWMGVISGDRLSDVVKILDYVAPGCVID